MVFSSADVTAGVARRCYRAHAKRRLSGDGRNPSELVSIAREVRILGQNPNLSQPCAIRDAGLSKEIRDCPGDSGTFGTYAYGVKSLSSTRLWQFHALRSYKR